MSTQMNNGIGDNIANIFGSKFLKTLLHFNISLDTVFTDAIQVKPRVEGFVSKVGSGVGRTDNDRQFFYVNGRPVDLPKVTKAVNEIWRQFEMKQKPACFINFILPPGSFDVNVTPDKRETFLQEVSFSLIYLLSY